MYEIVKEKILATNTLLKKDVGGLAASFDLEIFERGNYFAENKNKISVQSVLY